MTYLAHRSGTARVSRATYGMTAFPVLQTALCFVIYVSLASFHAWEFASLVNGACVFALFVSVLIHLVLSVGYAKHNGAPHDPRANQIALLFRFAWYAFIPLLFQATPYCGHPIGAAVCP